MMDDFCIQDIFLFMVWLMLCVYDVCVLIGFFVEVFGFEEIVVFVDGDVVYYVQLVWLFGGGVMFGLMGCGEGDEWLVVFGIGGVYVVIDDCFWWVGCGVM